MPFETFFSGRLKVKVTWGQIKIKMSIYLACPGHNLYIYAWISKNFAQLLSSRRRSAIRNIFFR